MCEFVCQVSILISVASGNYQTRKNFLVERIATGLIGRRRQPVRPSEAAVAGILTPPRPPPPPSVVAEGLRFCFRPVQSGGVKLVAEIPFAFPSTPVQ